MCKKKKINLYDENYQNLLNELDTLKHNLIGRVEIIITQLGVIELYPEGADKKKAIENCEKSKNKLLHYIKDYDSKLSDITRYYELNQPNTDTYWRNPDCFCTSHEIVEIAYRNAKK